ncbi:MAG: hypothetical protein ACLFUU_01715 [Desulfobacteraceae bacterium]
MDYTDLRTHIGILISLIGFFAGLSGFLFWRFLSRLEGKLDRLFDLSFSCRESLAQRFVSREEHNREVFELWEAVNNHDHDEAGRVVRC